MSKNLVAYFSASGETRKAAEKLSKVTKADIYEIRPEEPYTEDDLNWRNDKSRSSVEMKNISFRPALADVSANVEQYDTIFIGFPIWWYIAPTIINTFLESYDFEGKAVILFATSGGSGMGKVLDNLQVSCPYDVNWKSQKLLSSNVAIESLLFWVKGMNL